MGKSSFFPRRSMWRVAGAIVAAVLLAGAAAAQPVAPQRESLVKAAFLHKFADFVEWPAETGPAPGGPLKIAVVGNEEVLSDLAELALDRRREGRPVQVTRLSPGQPLAGHHIVYIRPSTQQQAADLLAQVPEGVLTIADIQGTHPPGSVMSFAVEEGRVRFNISLGSAARQKLKLSSRLLSVARIIQGLEEPIEPVYADAPVPATSQARQRA